MLAPTTKDDITRYCRDTRLADITPETVKTASAMTQLVAARNIIQESVERLIASNPNPNIITPLTTLLSWLKTKPTYFLWNTAEKVQTAQTEILAAVNALFNQLRQQPPTSRLQEYEPLLKQTYFLLQCLENYLDMAHPEKDISALGKTFIKASDKERNHQLLMDTRQLLAEIYAEKFSRAAAPSAEEEREGEEAMAPEESPLPSAESLLFALQSLQTPEINERLSSFREQATHYQQDARALKQQFEKEKRQAARRIVLLKEEIAQLHAEHYRLTHPPEPSLGEHLGSWLGWGIDAAAKGVLFGAFALLSVLPKSEEAQKWWDELDTESPPPKPETPEERLLREIVEKKQLIADLERALRFKEDHFLKIDHQQQQLYALSIGEFIEDVTRLIADLDGEIERLSGQKSRTPSPSSDEDSLLSATAAAKPRERKRDKIRQSFIKYTSWNKNDISALEKFRTELRTYKDIVENTSGLITPPDLTETLKAYAKEAPDAVKKFAQAELQRRSPERISARRLPPDAFISPDDRFGRKLPPTAMGP